MAIKVITFLSVDIGSGPNLLTFENIVYDHSKVSEFKDEMEKALRAAYSHISNCVKVVYHSQIEIQTAPMITKRKPNELMPVGESMIDPELIMSFVNLNDTVYPAVLVTMANDTFRSGTNVVRINVATKEEGARLVQELAAERQRRIDAIYPKKGDHVS